MQTQTITAPAAQVLNGTHPIAAPTDQFSIITTCSGVIATEFSYNKDEDIYGEGEFLRYVYQVIRGAVRTYKLLNDGRRQIGAFHLPGDVFGLESGLVHRLTAEAIADTTVRLVKRRSLERAAGITVQVARSLWAMTAGELRHAEDQYCCFSVARARWNALQAFCLDTPPPGQDRHDGASDVPEGHRRLSGAHPRNSLTGAFSTAQ